MKRLLPVLALALLLLLPASAAAKKKGPVYVPSSQSAASQYTEDVPTAGGNTPASNVRHAISPVGSSHGGGGSGGSISSSTLHAMSSSGSTGAAAAALAQALSPATSLSRPPRRPATQHPTHVAADAGLAAKDLPATHPSSAAGQVVDTLTGADAGSGIGALLPLILIGSLVLATGFGILRLRGPGTP